MEQNNNTRRVISLLVDNSNGVLARISSILYGICQGTAAAGCQAQLCTYVFPQNACDLCYP